MSVPPVASRAQFSAYHFFILCLSLWALLTVGVGMFFTLSDDTRTILWFGDTVACGIFFIDFLLTFSRAPDKLRYLMTWGWLDLLSSIPAVGPLRFGRLASVFRILRVMRAVRAARTVALFMTGRSAQSAFLAAVLASLILLMTASIAILHFEAGADPKIKTAHDAMWWAISTMTTVGSNDVYPTTPEGRLIGAFVMAAGVGVFGILSGLAASWFLKPTEQQEDKDIVELKEMVRGLQGELAARR
jgi:voltage-gated potassium channel